RGHTETIGAKGNSEHLISVTHGRTDAVSGADVPNERGEVFAPSDYPASVATKACANDAIPVNEWTPDRISCLGIPSPRFTLGQLAVLTGRDKAVRVEAEFSKTHFQGMAEW